MAAIQILDDSDPAVSYSSGWQVAGGSNEYNATTSWANQPGMTATLTFVGVQVSVVGTIGPRSVGLVSPQSNYTVDGGTSNVYTANQDQTVHYNTRFYLSPTLPDGQHTLVVTNLLNSDSFFIDYFLIYKTATDTSFSPKVTGGSANQTSTTRNASPSNSNTGTIVGSALGAAALIIAAVAFILWLRGRNKQNTEEVTESRFREDRESVPASSHTRVPSDTLLRHPFASTSSDVAQPSPITQQAQDIPYDALPPPPGYTSGLPQPLHPVRGPSSGNPLASKVINLNYNTSPANTGTV